MENAHGDRHRRSIHMVLFEAIIPDIVQLNHFDKPRRVRLINLSGKMHDGKLFRSTIPATGLGDLARYSFPSSMFAGGSVFVSREVLSCRASPTRWSKRGRPGDLSL